jgi:DHA3 family macrolide efflux protein-like MFS transporter
MHGFRWVFGRPPLRTLLLFFMVVNVGVSIFTTALAPYVLAHQSSHVLGLILALQGAGMFLTGMVLSRRKRRGASMNPESQIFAGSVALGLLMLMWGINRSAVGLCCVSFAIGCTVTLVMAASQTVWQMTVPIAIQGKVFAVRTVTSFGLAPLSILVSAPLASSVFAPLQHAAAWWAAPWQSDRSDGLGLMTSAMGAAIALLTVGLMVRGGLRLNAQAPLQEA